MHDGAMHPTTGHGLCDIDCPSQPMAPRQMPPKFQFAPEAHRPSVYAGGKNGAQVNAHIQVADITIDQEVSGPEAPMQAANDAAPRRNPVFENLHAIQMRCSTCGKLLARCALRGVIEIVCPRCKTLVTQIFR